MRGIAPFDGPQPDFNRARDVIRIFSDLHYGDRASNLRSLAELMPLFDGAAQVVLNGDTLDTRPSRNPAATQASKNDVVEFFETHAPPTTWLTGNHDPTISDLHAVEFADRRVFVTHGDILFENLVPWGRDAAVLSGRVAAELARLSPTEREQLDERFLAYRRAAEAIPQRHQSERNCLKYALGFAADTIWPPLRILRVLQAWKETPARAASLVKRHNLPAQVFVMGHTHRLGISQAPGGVLVINTGSFCPPCAGGVVDISSTHVLLRSVERRANEFRLGATIAEFALARVADAETLKV
jgi:predicted phosphodiesterase